MEGWTGKESGFTLGVPREEMMVSSKSKILIVDDDKDLCGTLCEILGAAGYDCITAHDGISAVAVAHDARPDGVILDIKMPAGDGFSVYNRLKLSVHTRDIPVVFISGYYEGEILGELFVRKPFDPDELIAHLKEILEEKGSAVHTKDIERA